MAQMAQQDHLVIDCGESFQYVSEEVKAKLRKAYLRGTLLDVVLSAVDGQDIAKTKIIASHKYDDDHIDVYLIDSIRDESLLVLDCGLLQPEDYTDDVPYDGE